MVDVVDLLQMRVLHQCDLVEAGHDLAHLLERGVQCAERLHVGLRAHVFVAVQNGQAVLVLDRDDGFVETSLIPRLLGALLGLHGQLIRLVAGKAVFSRDDISRDTLWHEILFHCQRWINGDCRTVAAHGHTAHHFNASGDIAHACTATHLIGGKVYGLHAGRAETVDGKTGNAFIQIGRQHRRAGKTPALFHHLGDISPDHILNGVSFKVVALFQCIQGECGQAQGSQLV